MKDNMQGKIVRIISNLCTVDVNGKLYHCKPRGKFYHLKLTPLVGDTVVIDEVNNYILDILPRKNELSRPMIANVDSCIIVTSVKEPSLSLLLLDKMLSIIIYNKINPIICFSKTDLLTKEELEELNKIYDYYNKIGIPTIFNTETDKLDALIKNKIVVLTGQTGAGKSSLINKLNPHLNLETNHISKALGRGVHTTRHVELFPYKESLIADTPGFSSLDLNKIKKEELKNTFIEFGNNCQFKDCMHLKEQNCNVKERVNQNIIMASRYENYQKMVSEIESIRIVYKK